MNAFTYYFDYRLLPTAFDSYFTHQVIDEVKEVREVKEVKPVKIVNVKYVPTMMEASTIEFKRTKYNNRNVPIKRKNKRKKV